MNQRLQPIYTGRPLHLHEASGQGKPAPKDPQHALDPWGAPPPNNGGLWLPPLWEPPVEPEAAGGAAGEPELFVWAETEDNPFTYANSVGVGLWIVTASAAISDNGGGDQDVELVLYDNPAQLFDFRVSGSLKSSGTIHLFAIIVLKGPIGFGIETTSEAATTVDGLGYKVRIA